MVELIIIVFAAVVIAAGLVLCAPAIVGEVGVVFISTLGLLLALCGVELQQDTQTDSTG